MGCLRHKVNDHSPDILEVGWGGVGGTVSHLIGEGQILNVFNEKLFTDSAGICPGPTAPGQGFALKGVLATGCGVVTVIVNVSYRVGVAVVVQVGFEGQSGGSVSHIHRSYFNV